MRQYIKDKLPEWYKNLDEDTKLLLTNDIDSLLSCYFLNKYFNCQIKGFYNFKELYFAKDTKIENFVGVDLDTVGSGRSFGNHLSWYTNQDAINLNNLYNEKYYKKYPFSTVMLILSLYDINIEKWTDEQLKVLLAIDSAFVGYYSTNKHFVEVYTDWLDRLDFRFLEDRILKHMTKKDFRDIQMKYNLNGSIEMFKGKLYTNINLSRLSVLFDDIIELPQDCFVLNKVYETVTINPFKDTVPEPKNIFSMAWIYKNTLTMSLYKK